MRLMFVLAIIAALASCDKKCPCPDEIILPIYSGYDSSQVDTIKITRFEKGSNFSKAVDSFELNFFNSLPRASGNTISLLGKDLDHRIVAGYDWQITNPFDNKAIQISEIETEKREDKCGGSLFGWDRQGCQSPNKSFNVNGSPYTIDYSFMVSGVVIKK